MSEMRFILAAGPVVIENGNVLLVKHGEDPFWKFPGGKWEKDDLDLEATAKREVREELGIDVTLVAPLKTVLVRLPNGDIAILVHFLASHSGVIQPGPHIKAWKWFPCDALPTDSAPNIKPVLADYHQCYLNRP